MGFKRSSLLIVGSALLSNCISLRQTPPVWETLPPTPELPTPITTEKALLNGVHLWSQQYNPEASGVPIVLDHGGLGYSAYFGSVISRLVANGHHVIAVDRRGHGRSTFNEDDVFTFDQFASDIYDQLNLLNITSYDVVGWSDGGATTLAALLNTTIAPTIRKAFVFGAFASFEDTNTTFPDTDIYSEFVSRCRAEYGVLQPGVSFSSFATKVGILEATLPQYTDEQLGRLDGRNIAIVDAEFEEAVNLDVGPKLHAVIPGSKLITLTGVSHFAPVQDPEQFTQAIEEFFKGC